MTADKRPGNELLRLFSDADFAMFQQHAEWFGARASQVLYGGNSNECVTTPAGQASR